MGTAVVIAAHVGIAVVIAAPAHAQTRCTIGGYQRWTRQHSRDGRIPRRLKPWMWRLEACLDHRHGPRVRLVAIRSRMRLLRAQSWDLTHPWQTGVVSWYQDAGQTASGWHAQFGFATCGTGGGPCLPFGARVRFCLNGCVVATADDHGPYVPGRAFDLGQSTAQAIGLQGVQTVRWRLMP